MSSSLQVIAGLSGLFATGAVLYRLIRPKFPIKVTCWFCSSSTTVPFFNLNCWNCPDCDQYNGFNAEGDYNKLIPAQYDEGLNHIFTASQCSGHRPMVQSYNGLCSDCNRNQHLIVRQLALFEPINDKNYDVEVENYRCHLESLYKLCAPCKSLVDYELKRQNCILTKLVEEKEEFESTKSEYSSHKNSPFVIKRTPFIVHILWFWTVLTSFVTACANLHMTTREWLMMKFNSASVIGEDILETLFNWTHFEGLVGLLVFLAATFIHGSARLRSIDAICALIRLPLIALHIAKHWTIYEEWILIIQMFLSCLCCLITCISVLSHYSCFKFFNCKKSNIYKSDCVEPREIMKSPGLHKERKVERNTIHYEDQDFAEEEDDLDLGGNLGAMSLGPHSPKTKPNLSTSASFLTSVSSSHSVNSSSSGSSFCRKRPLLSPSRFNSSTMSNSACRATSSLSCTCTTYYNNSNRKQPSSFNEFEHSDYDNDSNISETSTNCLVDTTTGPVPDSTSAKQTQPKKKKIWLMWLLGTSIGINLSLFLYVLHTTKIWTGIY